MAAAAADEFPAATDVADMLVKRGVPFRQAHGTVGARGPGRGGPGQAAVRAHRARSWPSWRPQLDDPDAFYALLGDGAWLESKASEGGTALARVHEQLAQARAVLAE